MIKDTPHLHVNRVGDMEGPYTSNAELIILFVRSCGLPSAYPAKSVADYELSNKYYISGIKQRWSSVCIASHRPK